MDQHGGAALQVICHAMESLANVLINVAALGLYSLEGLVLLPAVFATPSFSRWLAWLGAAEWGYRCICLRPGDGPCALYAPWVWEPSVPHSGIRCAQDGVGKFSDPRGGIGRAQTGALT